MIYIKEDSYERRMYLLGVLADKDDYELVVWLFPDAHINSLMDYELLESSSVKAEACTVYKREGTVKCTPRIPLTTDALVKLKKHKSVIQEYCDSICIYHVHSHLWQTCVVGHEKIALVKNIDIYGYLKKLGFNASLSPPDWW